MIAGGTAFLSRGGGAGEGRCPGLDIGDGYTTLCLALPVPGFEARAG